MPISTSDEPTIQRMKMSGLDTVTRSRGTNNASTPSFTSTRMSKSSPMRPVPKSRSAADALFEDVVQRRSMVLVSWPRRARGSARRQEADAVMQLPRRQRPQAVRAPGGG